MQRWKEEEDGIDRRDNRTYTLKNTNVDYTTKKGGGCTKKKLGGKFENKEMVKMTTADHN